MRGSRAVQPRRANLEDRLKCRKQARCRAPRSGRQDLDYRGRSAARRARPATRNAPIGTPGMPSPKASRALDRFTVLDLSQVRSGPTCVRQLADWGANVVKIEPPPSLTSGEAPGGPREGPDFQNLHRNKRAITLNLKSPEGLAAF